MSKTKSGNWFIRHKAWSTIIGLLVLFSIIGAIGSSNTPANNDAKPASKTTNSTASLAKLNQPANDGKLQFIITSLQCGKSQIEQPGNTDIATTAGAPYCVMNLSMKDIATEAQTFVSDSQYLYNASGSQYSVDSDATIDANPVSDNCMLDPTVNPGVILTCTLVYDVPANTAPIYATLHDSSLSGGVKVSLE